MATANLKKKLGFGDKYHRSSYLGGPESATIEIPPFRPHFIHFSKTVFYEVNLTYAERGDFN